MEPFPEHNSKQASRTEPKTEDINEWDVNQLLGWIQQKKTQLLTPDDVEILRKARISGEVFVTRAGDTEFFEKRCKLPVGVAVELANLWRKVVEQKGKEQDTSTGKFTNHAPSLFSLH